VTDYVRETRTIRAQNWSFDRRLLTAYRSATHGQGARVRDPHPGPELVGVGVDRGHLGVRTGELGPSGDT
jgi:hypothetical protein